ncbi:MAG: LysR family transcriptional regulator [Gluconacetobacter diazotrophicus]|nr:LysR family transcriptional regulator [Gluconacetobacter diazotrophicus]
MDRLRAFEVFVAVAELGGFGSAARRLAISPAAATRAVAFLEAHLGSVLFLRSTRSVVLTEQGRVLLDRARDALERVQDAEDAVRGTQDVPRGELRITAPAMFGRLHVLPVVAALLRRHRDLRAHLLLLDRNVRLVEEGIDIAVRIGVLADSALSAVTIGTVRQCLVASPEYCAERGIPTRPDQLPDHDLVGGDSPRTGPHWRVAGEHGRGLAVVPRLAVNTVDARLAAAAAGLGIANVLDYQAAAELASGALRPLLEEFAPPPLPVQLVFHPSRARLPAVRRFIDGMRERARTEFAR